MGTMMAMWRSRNLTMEGKSLITKCFGLSQLTYNLQIYGINAVSIKLCESLIFGFQWLANKSNKEKGIDRVKRSIMKNEYSEGGLNITDVESLNKALKVKQFIRASRTRHPISKIQMYCLEKGRFTGKIIQEYYKMSAKEEITRVAMETINFLCDNTRNIIINNIEELSSDVNAIYYIATTDVRSYLLIKKKVMINCMFTPLRREGVELLHELCMAAETEQDNL